MAVGTADGVGLTTEGGGRQNEPGKGTFAMNVHWSGPHGASSQPSAPEQARS